MVIDNNLYCVIYSLTISKYDSVVPEESIYNFILCKNIDEYYFVLIKNKKEIYMPNVIIDSLDNITKTLNEVSLLTRMIEFFDLKSASQRYVIIPETKCLYTLNDLLTIGEELDFKKYSYKIKKNFEKVLFHIDLDTDPVCIYLTKKED